VRRDDRVGQPFGCPEGPQRGVMAATDEFEHAAAVTQPHPGGRLGFGADGAFGLAECPLGVLDPSLGYHRDAEGQVGDAGDWLIGPAVLPGQLDRLQAPLRAQLERPPAQQLGQVRQAGNLQVRPSYAAGQSDAVVEVPVRRGVRDERLEVSGHRRGVLAL